MFTLLMINVNMKHFFGEKSKKPGQIDSIRDTGTEYHKPGLFLQNRFVRLFLF